MKFSDLQKISKADQKRSRITFEGLMQYDLKSYLRYLAYRIKRPIFFKIITRLIIIAEILFIHQLFSYNIFADLTLFIYVILIGRMALKGLTQYYRVKLMPWVTERNCSAINIGLTKALIVNFFCSLFLAIGISLICTFLNHSNHFNLYFVISWCLLIPIEQITSQLWNTVYLKNRLRRSMLVQINCRLIPILILVAFSSSIGPLSYVLGTFIARLLECIYLSSLALKTLKFKFTLKKKAHSPAKILLQYFHNTNARQYLFFNAILPCYFLVLGFAIFERGIGDWVANIIYFFSLHFAVFLSTQISRSIQFDIYSTIKKGLIAKANFLASRAVLFTLLITLAAILGFVSLLLASKVFYLFLPISLENFLLIIPFAILAQTFFYLFYAQLQSLAIDRHFTKILFYTFILIGLPAQLILLDYYLANLQAIYWFEVILFFISGMILKFNLNFRLSPFLIKHIKKERKLLPLCAPSSLQLQIRTQYLKTGRVHLYLLAYYERDAFWERIRHSLPKTQNILLSEYSSNLYLLSSLEPLADSDFQNLSFVTKLTINLNNDLLATLLQIYQLIYSFEARSNSSQKILNKFYINKDEQEALYRLAETNLDISVIIPELQKLPQILINYKKIVCHGNVSQKLYNFALNQYFFPEKSISKYMKGSLLKVKLNSSKIMSFDLSTLNSAEISQVSRKLFFLNQYYYFKNIIDSNLRYSGDLSDYLISRRLINQYAHRTNSTNQEFLADLNFYNHKIV